jgi:ABC-2 type transport system permease protein
MSSRGATPGTGFLRLVSIVARRDYLRTVRRRGFIVGTLLLPLGLGLVFMISGLASANATNGPTGAEVELLIVNESSLTISWDPRVLPNVALTGVAVANAQLANGGVSEYYRIPPGYPTLPAVDRIEAAQHGPGLENNQRQATQQQVLEALLRDALLADSNLTTAQRNRVIAPVQINTQTSSGEPVSDTAVLASFLVPFAFTLLFVMSIFITSGYLLQSVTEEKENRVVEIVLSSVPSMPLMAGKILGLGAAGLTQVAIWLITGLIALPLLSDKLGVVQTIHLSPGLLLLAVLYFVLGYLAFGGIFAAIGALAPGNREAQQYSGFFGFFAVIPLILTSVLLTDPTSPLVWFLALFPLTAPATMLQELSLASPPPAMVVLSLLSLTLFVCLSMVASARIFRATLLLYGVRPGLRQVIDAVRTQG